MEDYEYKNTITISFDGGKLEFDYSITCNSFPIEDSENEYASFVLKQTEYPSLWKEYLHTVFLKAVQTFEDYVNDATDTITDMINISSNPDCAFFSSDIEENDELLEILKQKKK